MKSYAAAQMSVRYLKASAFLRRHTSVSGIKDLTAILQNRQGINKTGAVGVPAIKRVRQLYLPAASDMRYARLKLQRRIEYHCDPRAQYHFCKAKISRRAVRGISLKYLYRPTVHIKVQHTIPCRASCVKKSTNKLVMSLSEK